MGFLSDLFGGPKAPSVPPEMAEAMRHSMALGKDFESAYDDAIAHINENREYIERDLSAARSDFSAARSDFSAGRNYFNDLSGQLAERLTPGSVDNAVLMNQLQEQGIRGMMDMGSPERQRLESMRARDAAMSGITASLEANRMAGARAGLTPGSGGVNSPRMTAMLGAQAGNAVNQARLAERNYGEQTRANFMPAIPGMMASNVNMAAMPGTLRAQAGNMQSQAANMQSQAANMSLQRASYLPQLYGQAIGSVGMPTLSAYGSAGGQAGNMYNAQMMKNQADVARHKRIWDTVGRIGAGIATGGQSEIPRAAGGGGGGGGGWGTFGGGGGGGGGGASNINFSTPSQPWAPYWT